jgi:ComF family protein
VSGEAGTRPAVAGRKTREARSAFISGLPSISNCRPLLRDLVDSLFAVVFPTQCSICGGEVADASGLGVCRDCWLKVEAWEGISCELCGLPIISEHAADAAQVLCGVCRANDPSFDLARTFGIYRGTLRLLILQLKFRRRERLGKRLGACLARFWERLGPLDDSDPFLIVPVPLFHLRERARGFNQARVLAEGLMCGIEKKQAVREVRIESSVLARSRATLPQAGLKFQARKENVRGAFSVVKPKLVERRQIVLVDDVMTTGATLSACAAVLKKRGASRVYALALARATPQFPDVEVWPQATGIDEFGRDWR